MSIEEKRKPLEFVYTPDDVICSDSSIIQFNIIYNDDPLSSGNIQNYPLTIRNGNEELHCPVELLQEVLEFLGRRGMLKEEINVPSKEGPLSTTLPLPHIEKGTETVSGVSPFTSFDVSVSDDSFGNISEENSSKDESIKKSKVKSVNKKDSGIKVDQNTTSDVPIDRPVIRTNHVEEGEKGDPTAAEKQAAMLRGEPNSKRVIKRKED